MTTLAKAAALGVALACASMNSAAAQMARAEQPPPPTSVSSTDQKGGITAGSVTIYQTDKPDPERQRLADVLVSFNRKLGDQVHVEGAGAANIFFWTGRPSRDGRSKDVAVYFMTFEGGPDEEEGLTACGASSEIGAFAMVASASFTPGAGKLRTEAATSKTDDVVRRICEGLSQPLSFLTGGSSAPRDQRTVFDYLLARSDAHGFALVLMAPGAVGDERLSARNYWMPALTAIYRGDIAAFKPELTPELAESLGGDDPARIDMDLPSWMRPTEGGPRYPATFLAEFDGEIEQLDQMWDEYLKKSQVTVRGVARPLAVKGEFVAPLAPVPSSEVGNREFWRAGGDFISVTKQLNCIAARFLVDHKYANQRDVPHYSLCPVSEILAVSAD